MLIHKSEIQNAVEVLHSNSTGCESLIKVLSSIMTDAIAEKRDFVKLIDENHYIAIQLWGNEDIVDALEQHGIDPSDENIQMVREAIAGYLEDCSDGNEAIAQIIEELFEFGDDDGEY